LDAEADKRAKGREPQLNSIKFDFVLNPKSA
jgi:hypothetical protein